jgi:hypothetical protein
MIICIRIVRSICVVDHHLYIIFMFSIPFVLPQLVSYHLRFVTFLKTVTIIHTVAPRVFVLIGISMTVIVVIELVLLQH